MKISEYVGNDIVIIEPYGRLTVETNEAFRRAIASRIEQGWNRLILDFQHIDFLDSAGLGALVDAYTWADARGIRMVLVHVFGRNRSLLALTKLLTVFEVYETTFEAERSFIGPAKRWSCEETTINAEQAVLAVRASATATGTTRSRIPRGILN
jgi:anti-anti-sigma factor